MLVRNICFESSGGTMFSRFFRNPRGQQGKGQGGGNRPGAGPTGYCVCPKCGHEIEHRVNQRCMDLKCPKCGSQMIRK